MCKCSNCKFSEFIWDMEGNEYFWCMADGSVIEIETAENNDLGCGYYVEDMDADC